MALSDPRGGASPWFHPAWTLGRVRVQFRCKVLGARVAVAPRLSVSTVHSEWAGASSPKARTASRPGPVGGGSCENICLPPLAEPKTSRAGPRRGVNYQ